MGWTEISFLWCSLTVPLHGTPFGTPATVPCMQSGSFCTGKVMLAGDAGLRARGAQLRQVSVSFKFNAYVWRVTSEEAALLQVIGWLSGSSIYLDLMSF